MRTIANRRHRQSLDTWPFESPEPGPSFGDGVTRDQLGDCVLHNKSVDRNLRPIGMTWSAILKMLTQKIPELFPNLMGCVADGNGASLTNNLLSCVGTN